MKYLLVPILLIMCLIPQKIHAQEPIQNPHHQTWVMAVPIPLFFNGINIEMDKRLTQGGRWIVYSPTLYFRDQQGTWLGSNQNVQSMYGLSMEVQLRWYPLHEKKEGGIYLSAGPGYRFISRKMEAGLWTEYVENDLTWYRFDTRITNRITQSLTLKAQVGIHKIYSRHFAIDYFTGIGLKISRENNHSLEREEMHPFSYGGSGFFLVAGIRAGIGW